MSGGSSVYSPLPQSNSDSDDFSEEELHSSSERQRVISHISKLQKQTKPEIILNGKKKQNVTNYKQLDNDRDIGITLNGFQLDADEVAIQKPNNKLETFSTSRKICFAFSIFLCIFTTVVFLWILPCEIGSCPPASPAVVANSWKKILTGIELHGPISVVPNARDGSQNLVFLFRNSFSSETEQTSTSGESSGVISLLGGNREISWWVTLKREPKDIDCNILDVDLDGVNDCLVVGKNNLLKAIQSSFGNKLWDIQDGEQLDKKSCDFDFPVVLPDVDGDRVSDLLTICSVDVTSRESRSQHFFVLISGRNGTTIGKFRKIPHCSYIHNFMLDREYLISYACLDMENKESTETIPLRNVLIDIEPSRFVKVQLNRSEASRPQHKFDSEQKYCVQGRCLTLENHGRCPDNCNMVVTIKDERTERSNHSSWTMKNSNSYGMTPVMMRFNRVNGFVFKYWQWRSNMGIGNKFVRSFKTDNDSQTDAGYASGEGKPRIRGLREPNLLEYELFSGDMPDAIRCKRMLTKRLSGGGKESEGSIFKDENFTFHRIIERVVLITFNETDTHFINASQFEVTQICKHVDSCQPDVLYQKNSLLITDLDHDNYQELVSYSSSFVSRVDEETYTSNNLRWQLQSTVQVIRLESELPKLYDSKNQ